MRSLVMPVVGTFLFLAFSAVSNAADGMTAVKKVASLSEFRAKLGALEKAVDDISFAAALALLKHEFPEWEFSRASGSDSVSTSFSNDLGAVTARHEYGMGKLRGAVFRNESVTDEERELALQLVDGVKSFILDGYQLEDLIDGGDREAAGQFYKEQILKQAEELNNMVGQLANEIDQTIKFSAL